MEITDKAKLDGVYANALRTSSVSGMFMDIKILVGSVFAVLKSKGVVEGGTGAIAKETAKVKEL